jgi:hypothetical protein
MDKPQFWARRKFLNKQGYHSSAHYIVSVKPEEGKGRNGKPWRQVSSTFLLADCSRSINLEFSLYGSRYGDENEEAARKEIANTLYKARLLRSVVNDFVDHLEAAAEWLESE